MTIEVGAQAPDFALKDQHGAVVRLSDLTATGPVVLVFYPFAFSGICSGELCELRDNPDVFSAAGVQVVGVSCDPVHALRAFAEAEKYEFPLLSDFWPHGGVATTYGVFNDTMGAAIRGTFLIDGSGVVRWAIVNGPGQARPLTAYREAVAAL